MDEADSEMATNNTRVGQVHTPTTTATLIRKEWIDLVDDDWERDPLIKLECWSNSGRANFDPSTEIPLLIVPSDASTRDEEKAWVSSISAGVKKSEFEPIRIDHPNDEVRLRWGGSF